MGYSLAIRVQSDTQRRKFLKFICMNFHHWSIVCGKDPSKWQGSVSDPTDDLSYGKTKTSIGFDYQSGLYGFERDYLYSVIRWMAIKVGDRKTKMLVDSEGKENVTHKFLGPTPYYIYDGQKTLTPVLVVTEEQAISPLSHWSVDEWGVRIGTTAVELQIGSCIGLFEEEWAKIAREVSPGGAREAYLKICLKYLKPKIDENLALIRQEVQRLDRLWADEISPRL